MFELKPNTEVPYYQQIVQTLRHQIMTSKMHPHEKLPSVRALAKQLSINPNTVQKSYGLLREQGLIYSIAGKGEFVADNLNRLKELKKEQLVQTFITATKEARDSGMWIDEIFQIVDEAYSET